MPEVVEEVVAGAGSKSGDWQRKNAVATFALQSLPSTSADEDTRIEHLQLSPEDMDAVVDEVNKDNFPG